MAWLRRRSPSAVENLAAGLIVFAKEQGEWLQTHGGAATPWATLEVLAFLLHLSDRSLFVALGSVPKGDRLLDELINATFGKIVDPDGMADARDALTALVDHYNVRTEEYGQCTKMLGEGSGVDQSAGDWHLWMVGTQSTTLPDFWLWREFQSGLKMRIITLDLPRRIAEIAGPPR